MAPHRFASGCVVLLLALASPSAARADEIPDPTWAAVKGSTTVLRFADSTELRAVPIAYDATTITIVESGTGRVLTLPRATVTTVLLGSAIPVAPAAPPPPPRVRHIGMQLSTGPGNVMVDFDYGRFYGYVGTSIGYPLIFTKDGNGGDQYAAAIIGAGGQWKLSPTSNWKFDLTANLIPTYWGGFSMGIGIAAGFHYTSPTGFTVGFKIPILGVAPGCNSVVGEEDYDGSGNSSGCQKVNKGGLLVANYYLQAGMSLPIVSVGYRY